jgi:ligand-binding sensor domain-containing protein
MNKSGFWSGWMSEIIRLFSFYYLITCKLAYAQVPAPTFVNYRTNHGLTSSEVHCVYQDRQGYLWFGTDNGVSRFDGYRFITYGHNAGISYNVITNILEDQLGRIWFSALNGQVYIKEDDSILPYRYNDVLQQYHSRYVDGEVIGIDSNETVYFDLVGSGLLIIDCLGQSRLLHGSSPNSIAIFRMGDIMTATNSYWSEGWGNTRPDDKEMFLEYFMNSPQVSCTIPLHIRDVTAHRAFKIDEDQILFCSRKGIYCLNKDSLAWEVPIGYMVHDLFPSSGGIWMGLSHNQGLRYYQSLADLQKGSYFSFLKDETITDIFQDRDGGLWIATHDSGVFYSANLSVNNFSTLLGLESDLVRSIAFKSGNEMFLGFNDGGTILVDLKDFTTSQLNLSKAEGYSVVYDLFYDNQRDVLWVDNEYIDHGKVFTMLRNRDRWIRFGAKKYFYDQKDDLLWLIKGWGFNKIDLRNNKLLIETSDYIPPTRFFSIYTDINGTVWTGSNDGLAEWRDTILIPVEVDHPAFKQRIEDIDAFNRTHLIFGTKGRGVIIWKEGKIIEVNTSHGLASDMIEDVHVDENNIAWIATFNGLSKITLDAHDQPTVRTFTIGNGLPSNEIYQIKSFEGQPWLCTGGGLVRWQDPPFEFHSYKPEIRQVWVNGESSSFRADFSHWENNLTIDFLTIDYQQFGQINYRYRLSASEPWSHSKNPSVSFARLNPGSYHFEIQSQNKDEVWSESTIYPFMIRRPWYATGWFVTLSALGLLAIGYFVLNWWNRRKREEERFKSEMDNLKKSALQAQMNPHFIFNCLNSIQSYINQGKKEDANTYLLNFANLIRGCLNASLEKEISLEQDIDFIRNYLDLESMRFSPDFQYEFDIDPVIQPDRILLEPMLILPFVENAVIHGLSRSDRKGQIKISYRLNEDCLHVSIKDNGEGLNRANDRTSKDHRKHKSVGITITRKRLELLDQNRNDWIRFHDISNGSAVKGTRVDLKIRIKTLDIKQMKMEGRDLD